MQDIGPAGPDKGKGGKYLVLPPGYEGEVPEGYLVVQSRTYNVWVFMRASIAKGLDVARENVEENLRIYPLSKKDNPPKLELFSGSGKSFNTIHSNDYTFYEHLNEVIQKQPLDGSRTYRLHLPPNPPAKDFWALTMYDNQTRSQLQTSQKFPTVGSQTEGIRQNEDGSYDIYFSPKPPKGYENNWLATVPGKGWFVALRMYGPLEPWIEKTWRPGEIELVE